MTVNKFSHANVGFRYFTQKNERNLDLIDHAVHCKFGL